MKKLLNTLYINNPDRYLSLDGENILILENKEVIGRVPLHNLDSIVTAGYTGVSPALMKKCVDLNINLTFINQYGHFLARVSGETKGNVLLRRKQFLESTNVEFCLNISSMIIKAKLYNTRSVLERSIRDHGIVLDTDKVKRASNFIKESLLKIDTINNIDSLRGIEGEAASVYFSVFNELILRQKNEFVFINRNKRPPTDSLNAMLSYGYTLLRLMYESSLESVGIDPYVGIMHTDRPGRKSLALDLMEELRCPFVDRFVLTLINKQIISAKHFITMEDKSVKMTELGRKIFLSEWQKKKQSVINHPYLKEKVEWGMIPYTQALLLARFLRGDLDGYPPFFWR